MKTKEPIQIIKYKLPESDIHTIKIYKDPDDTIAVYDMSKLNYGMDIDGGVFKENEEWLAYKYIEKLLSNIKLEILYNDGNWFNLDIIRTPEERRERLFKELMISIDRIQEIFLERSHDEYESFPYKEYVLGLLNILTIEGEVKLVGRVKLHPARTDGGDFAFPKYYIIDWMQWYGLEQYIDKWEILATEDGTWRRTICRIKREEV